MRDRNTDRIVFGDFQTPITFATEVCRYLAARGVNPGSVIEPTCGTGAFLISALSAFPNAKCLGVEVNRDYAEMLKAAVRQTDPGERVTLANQDFFDLDWPQIVRDLPAPLLFLGNPPWVTNTQLGKLGSSNLPVKSNFQGRTGLDAITGKSNFDISEWMLIHLLELLSLRQGHLVMLCKTAVARRVLVHAWKSGISLDWAEIRKVDAEKLFGASVDACLLACAVSPKGRSCDCPVYRTLIAPRPHQTLGWRDSQLIADLPNYLRWKHLTGASPYQWRSGVKHDCARVMELRKDATGYCNGFDERVELEDSHVFPMLKSSELTPERADKPTRYMLVTQRTVGTRTDCLAENAPKTWAYLLKHASALDARASSVYKNRPRFGVFGIGDYTFSPWKVAISGFYKRFTFCVVGPIAGKPVVLDDTGYFLCCESKDEAVLVASLLNSEPAKEFFSARVFWDAKRPITVDLLRQLDIMALAKEASVAETLFGFLGNRAPRLRQSSLFE